ncbi:MULTISPECIES: caspase, EACC1-associated type [unclassified Amycolatopsis]|uniref:caspase, EACC1-associated type n=1 Tax=unclassified Amycolatopsis TaxID=2618356 RepID=UPI002876B349|nr:MULTISPECIES: caspase family protein [unclassified Amycolatopsis]MDS0139991.1 caspase family protein [Amycolatopsis sp. 505]MDS0148097.1 caspase family protein [Amycolatopsis sp. CM201R]
MDEPWFPDAAASRAVLIGVSRYESAELPPIPAVPANLDGLRAALTDPALGSVAASGCRVLGDDATKAAVGAALTEGNTQAADLLLVYYSGHGVLDDDGLLHLALRSTDANQPGWTAIPITLLQREIGRSRAKARILVVDCCFSGQAAEAMAAPGGLVAGQLTITGGYTLASSASNQPSHAPRGARYTAFTGALLNALAAPVPLTMDGIYRHTDEELAGLGLPRPRRRVTDYASDIALVRGPVRRGGSVPASRPGVEPAVPPAPGGAPAPGRPEPAAGVKAAAPPSPARRAEPAPRPPEPEPTPAAQTEPETTARRPEPTPAAQAKPETTTHRPEPTPAAQTKPETTTRQPEPTPAAQTKPETTAHQPEPKPAVRAEAVAPASPARQAEPAPRQPAPEPAAQAGAETTFHRPEPAAPWLEPVPAPPRQQRPVAIPPSPGGVLRTFSFDPPGPAAWPKALVPGGTFVVTAVLAWIAFTDPSRNGDPGIFEIVVATFFGGALSIGALASAFQVLRILYDGARRPASPWTRLEIGPAGLAVAGDGKRHEVAWPQIERVTLARQAPGSPTVVLGLRGNVVLPGTPTRKGLTGLGQCRQWSDVLAAARRFAPSSVSVERDVRQGRAKP